MYKLTQGKVVIDDVEYTTYGIHYNDEYSVSDLSEDKKAVERLTEAFNKHALDPIHLNDAAEDFLNGWRID